MKIEKDVEIYLKGYRTGCGFTVEEYLNACEKVRTRGTKEFYNYKKLNESVSPKQQTKRR